jgi:SAM-dependent methyltransferase
MENYYLKEFKEYHQKTFFIDPCDILSPLTKHLSPGASILDVGCGSGRDLLWLKERGYRVTGFEFSKGLSNLARENAGCNVIEGNFRNFDFSKFSYDAIILIGALVHLPYKEFQIVLKGILNALTQNGLVLVSLNEGSGRKTDNTGRTFWRWQDIELREIFQLLELKVLEFKRQETKVGKGKIWLSYVLEKN